MGRHKQRRGARRGLAAAALGLLLTAEALAGFVLLVVAIELAARL